MMVSRFLAWQATPVAAEAALSREDDADLLDPSCWYCCFTVGDDWSLPIGVATLVAVKDYDDLLDPSLLV
ncbi:hypothetical protein Hdeb2414_s0063g00764401 [Helianthus debilis subsp. tardiflorus]